MLAHLDDVIRRLSSFFIIPLVNLLLLSAIVFFCSRDRISLASLIPPIDVGEGFRSFVEFIKTKSGVTQIDQQDLVRLFPGVAGLTNFLASASWITFLFLTFVLFFVVYLIDRTVYVIGWLMPFDYEFDPDFYAAAHARDQRVLDLYGLINSSPAFSKLYGIVKASLTADGSAQEEKDRLDILGQIRVADEWFSYAKGYIALLLVGLFPLSLLYNTVPLRLLLCLLIAFFLAALLTVRYVQSHQRLVEHDIDRFLSIELLARNDEAITIRGLKPNPDVSVLADLKNARMRTLNPVGRLLSKLYLRYEDSGILYTVSFFLPKKSAGETSMSKKAYFIVRATVADPAQRAAFDDWYGKEHLPDAVKAFGAEKAWRFWSETDPAVHQATYRFADRAALERGTMPDIMKPLVADFDRAWPGIPRTREIMTLAEEWGA